MVLFVVSARTSAMMRQELGGLQEMKDQLEVEVKVKPMPLSTTLDDLVKYIEANSSTDKLVTGFKTSKENPLLADKVGCVVS